MTERGKRRHISRAGRVAMASAGAENLRKWKAGQIAEATDKARERARAFEGKVRQELGEASAIVDVLIDSCVASYVCVLLVSSKFLLGSPRLARLKELHSLQVEAQRVLYRNLKALLDYQGSPDAKEARRARILERVRTEIAQSRAHDPRTEKGNNEDAEDPQGTTTD